MPAPAGSLEKEVSTVMNWLKANWIPIVKWMPLWFSGWAFAYVCLQYGLLCHRAWYLR